MFKQSKRKYNMCKCNHCSEWFLPDYFEHVRVPGFSEPLEQIHKSHFGDPSFRWMDAYVACPSTGCLDMVAAERNWVVENPNDAFVDSGVSGQSVRLPNDYQAGRLGQGQRFNDRPIDFHNQRLGRSLEDRNVSRS